MSNLGTLQIDVAADSILALLQELHAQACGEEALGILLQAELREGFLLRVGVDGASVAVRKGLREALR
eukprot:CAMPEP_0177271236 /NCGR_PEP_ID=MMETSP0367-20130122/65410_1 /TAXON_ID=447022 ORGANISM="Scrippsiella hangoei-like, Strain SHHI-4" /NCGR_SAMPLE_ID=MMETSP0367 /ASSEMBLY_ACC=CAM_ASM_000362 /LENGTH=67 /DNA_ID=CAMNT_0018727259 /DNA_START=281 /DNA_END=481 /DNA_ORIENTATION=-